jgi:hypothetical protein
MRRTLSILALVILAAWSAVAWAQSDGSLLLLLSSKRAAATGTFSTTNWEAQTTQWQSITTTWN